MFKRSWSSNPGRWDLRELLALEKEAVQTKGTANTAIGKLHFITHEVRQVDNTNCSLKDLEKPVGYWCAMVSWLDCDFQEVIPKA